MSDSQHPPATERVRCPEELSGERILVLDDESLNTNALSRILRQAGFEHVETVNDPRAALRMIRSRVPDLLISDIRMPHITGIELLHLLNDEIHQEISLPVMMITGDRDASLERRCLEAGARDFVHKPFRASEILLRIKNLLETRYLQKQLDRSRLELKGQVAREQVRAQEAELDTLRRLAMAAELRDDITGKHAERVGALAGLVANGLGLDAERAELIRLAAPLHDVGKIGIPDSILLKPDALDLDEFTVMKSHTVIGARLLSKEQSFPLLDLAREIALTHHERFDGCGYPQGLLGRDIPVSGRILAVADVFDSLTHERPYKRAFAPGTAMDLMMSQRALHFDPGVLDVFVDLFERGVVEATFQQVEGRVDVFVDVAETSTLAGLV